MCKIKYSPWQCIFDIVYVKRVSINIYLDDDERQTFSSKLIQNAVQQAHKEATGVLTIQPM